MFSDVCVFSLNACYFVPAASLRFAYMSNKSVVGDLVEALLAQGNDSGFRTFLEQFLLALERFLIATKAESYEDVTWIAHFIFLLCFVSHVFLSSDMSVLLFLCRTCGWRSPTGMTSDALRRPPKKQPMNLIDRKLHLRHLSCWNSEDFSSNRTGMDEDFSSNRTGMDG